MPKTVPMYTAWWQRHTCEKPASGYCALHDNVFSNTAREHGACSNACPHRQQRVLRMTTVFMARVDGWRFWHPWTRAVREHGRLSTATCAHGPWTWETGRQSVPGFNLIYSRPSTVYTFWQATLTMLAELFRLRASCYIGTTTCK